MKRAIPNSAHHRDDGVTEITITRRNGEKYVTLVDTWVYDIALKFLQIHVNPVRSDRPTEMYAKCSIMGETMMLHRLLADADCTHDKSEIDHIDGNSLNNLMSNLRAADRYDQMRNTRHTRHTSREKQR